MVAKYRPAQPDLPKGKSGLGNGMPSFSLKQSPLSPRPEGCAAQLGELNGDQREFFEERAAIYEFEAGFNRGDAEERALVDTRAKFGLA